jgi:hypothetical protein
MQSFLSLSRRHAGQKSLTGGFDQPQRSTFFSPIAQPKLAINPPGDIYEQEADAVAAKVVSMKNDENAARSFFNPAYSTVQRMCSECEKEEKQMQMKGTGNSETTSADGLENYIDNLNGSGQSLPSETLNFFGSRMGHDFSDVKIHTDEVAAKSATSISALAYTSGNNIVFNSGQYSPGTESGKKLLGHELTHIVQQSKAGQANIQRQPAAPPATHRFSAFGVNVVVRASCEPAVFGFATVETGVRAALDAIFNTECIEESRRTRIQRNLTAHGLDIRCRRSANLITPGSCAESTGFFIPANIFTLGSLSFPGHPEGDAACQPLESTILHEIVHLTRGFAGEQLPSSCEASCFGVGGGDPVLCRDIDVFGNRRAAP